MGWVGSFYEEMSNVAFWALVAGIAFAGSLLIFAVRKSLAEALGLCSNCSSNGGIGETLRL